MGSEKIRDTIAGYLLAFRGDDGDAAPERAVVVQVVDCHRRGEIEIAFDANLPKGSNRVYLRLNLPDLLRAVLASFV